MEEILRKIAGGFVVGAPKRTPGAVGEGVAEYSVFVGGVERENETYTRADSINTMSLGQFSEGISADV